MVTKQNHSPNRHGEQEGSSCGSDCRTPREDGDKRDAEKQ